MMDCSSHEAFLVIFDQIATPMLVVNHNFHVQKANRAFLQDLSVKKSEYLGQPLSSFYKPMSADLFAEQVFSVVEQTGVYRGQMVIERSDCSLYPHTLVIEPLNPLDTQKTSYLVQFMKSEPSQGLSHAQLYAQRYDLLTGLPERTQFLVELTHWLKISAEQNELTGVAFLEFSLSSQMKKDLSFREKDYFIADLSHRLRLFLKNQGRLSRVGDCSFAWLLPFAAEQNLEGYVDSLHKELEPAVNTGLKQIPTHYTMGFSFGVSNEKTATDLLDQALLACSQSLYQGADYLTYTAGLEKTIEGKNQQIELLKKALEEKNLEVYYQPQFSLAQDKIIGLEALVRLNDHQGQILEPAVLLPLAAEYGLQHQLSYVMLEQACEQFRRWQEKAYTGFKICVNFSATQMLSDDFIHQVATILDKTKIPPSCLELEMTEEALIENREKYHLVSRVLKSMGISLAIDDFGVGYSSLSQLSTVSLDTLKLDKSFLQTLESEQTQSIIKAIKTMAETMGCNLIVEGVETVYERDLLQSLGLELQQGHYFSPPVAVEAATELLASSSA